MFSIDEQIRYSEVNEDGKITIPALINLMQDCCMLHSETVGHGISHLKETGEFWFLASWQIDVIKTPYLYEKIKVVTNPYDFKGVFGCRNFEIKDRDTGERLVIANSIWVYVELATGSPKKAPADEAAAYGMGEKFEMNYAPRKIKLPQNFAAGPTITVRRDMIDTNHHMNNCQYVQVAMDAVNRVKMPAEIRAEYKKSALLGNEITCFVSQEPDRTVVDLRDAYGVSYATVEFID